MKNVDIDKRDDVEPESGDFLDLETYLKEWTSPLPDDATEAWELRVMVEAEMQRLRVGYKRHRSANGKKVSNVHEGVKKSSAKYRAYDRLATRLNLLLRYYGFDSELLRVKPPTHLDYCVALYKVLKSFADLSEQEKLLLEMTKTAIQEYRPRRDLKGYFNPDEEYAPAMRYSEIRERVLDNFTGNQEKDLAEWAEKPQFWVAQDEWHTERIRREREAGGNKEMPENHED